ncbi:FAD-dependent monooxygenase [Cupriavidus necator]
MTDHLPNSSLPSALDMETDVLIVGAGPVGGSLAVELALRGIRVQIVEQLPDIGSWWTRAMNCNKRSMEHLRRWGIAERLKDINFVPKGWPGNVTLVDTLGGRQITSVCAEGLGWQRVLPDASEDALWVTQGQLQQVVLEKAQQLGVMINFSSKAVSMTRRDDGTVCVGVESDGVTRNIGARYVVGCDGARSFVRETLGMTYQGNGALSRVVAVFFDAPDLLASMRQRGITDAVMYVVAKPEVRGVARLIQGHRWELQINLADDATENDIDPDAVVRALVGPGIDYKLERTFPFSYFDLVADRFGHEFGFIAGDAAHIIPPLGGHNLNLGIGDAVNLGWKLAHVLRGWAGDAILDSYSVERRAMVLRTKGEVLQNHARLYSSFGRLAEWMTIEGDDADTHARREQMGQDIGNHLYPQWVSDGIVLDLRYPDSPIVACDQAASEHVPYDPARNTPCAVPGHRAPMYRDNAGAPLYDRFGPEYTLLDLAPASDAGRVAAQRLTAAGLPVAHLSVTDESLRSLFGRPLTLIRPDQHVAWRGESLPADVEEFVHLLTGRPRVVSRNAA